jgi:hypothetical protein
VGSLDAEKDGKLIHSEFYTPFQLNKVSDEGMRKAMSAIIQSKAEFHASNVLPGDAVMVVSVAGLDKLYDWYVNYLLPPDEKQRLSSMEQFMQSMKLDLRQDIVGFFSNEATLAVLARGSMPMLLVTNSDAKQSTLAKINQLLSFGFLPTQVKPEQFGGISAQTVVMRGQAGQSLTYGALNKELIAIAPTPGFAELAKSQRTPDEHSLTKTKLFKELINDFPKEGNALVYVDMATMQQAMAMQNPLALAQGPVPVSGLAVMTRSAGSDLLEGHATARLNLEVLDRKAGTPAPKAH